MARMTQGMDDGERAALEEQLARAYETYGLPEGRQESVAGCLGQILAKDPSTYAHSIRVGLLAGDIAHYIHSDAATALCAGLVHDIGKTRIPDQVMQNASHHRFSAQDKQIMKDHALHSYVILMKLDDALPDMADIAVRHHLYQSNPYPIPTPRYVRKRTAGERLAIGQIARIIALADGYDAGTTRGSRPFPEWSYDEGAAFKTDYLTRNPDVERLVEDLFADGLLRLPIQPRRYYD
jgi:putative nucleotidyltransferase with HDIG domain